VLLSDVRPGRDVFDSSITGWLTYASVTKPKSLSFLKNYLVSSTPLPSPNYFEAKTFGTTPVCSLG
jgi:hypothetical protein